MINQYQIDLRSFLCNIANTTPVTKEFVNIVSIGFNLPPYQLLEEIEGLTQESYNGLNADCGDWIKAFTIEVFASTLPTD